MSFRGIPRQSAHSRQRWTLNRCRRLPSRITSRKRRSSFLLLTVMTSDGSRRQREVDLCGHATLASAYVIFNYLDDQARRIRFSTRSGPLTVERQNGLLAMNFPVLRPGPCGSPPDELIRGLGLHPDAILSYGEEDNSGYYVAVFKSEDAVRGIDPDFFASGRTWRHDRPPYGSGGRCRLRPTMFCSELWHRRRPCDRFGTLRSDTLLGRPAGKEHSRCPAGFGKRRANRVPAPGRPCLNPGQRGLLPGRYDRGLRGETTQSPN